jgi:tetratricopeptide (TPR) repeat protein
VNRPRVTQQSIILGVLCAAFVGATAGCTTSRAVLAWEAGAKAETAGKYDTAVLRYGEAAGRNGQLVGAALGRIRVLARLPDRRKEADELLTDLMKKQASHPAVAAFAAYLALVDGDAKLARKRFDAGRALLPEDAPDVAQARQEVEVALLAAEGKAREAHEKALALGEVHPRTGLLRATLAWNAGDAPAATTALALAPDSPQRAVLQALLARGAGDWAVVTAALAKLEGEAVTPLVLALKAEALLSQGESAKALEQAAEAVRRDPTAAYPTEVWAAAQLGAGQAALAKDLLAGLTARGAGWSAWHNLGICQVKLGDLAAASAAFDQALARCPTCEAPRKNREVLKKIGF